MLNQFLAGLALD